MMIERARLADPAERARMAAQQQVYDRRCALKRALAKVGAA